MKYFLLFTLSLITVLSNAQNLIENGDFETGTFHSGGQNWFLGGSSSSKVVEAAEAGNIHAGDYSAKISHSTDGQSYAVNYIYNSTITGLTPGETYVFSVYAKALDATSGTKELKMNIKHDLTSAVGTWEYTQKTIELTESYTKYEFEYMVPDGFNSLQLNLWFGTYAGTFYIDDVVFEKVQDDEGTTGKGEIYVSNDGDNTNSGTLEAPYKTIAHAASVMVPGDTVVIRGGTYTEEVVLKSGTAEKSTIIKAYEGEEVIVDGRLPLTNWVNAGTNIWEATATGLNSRPSALSINDELKALGRHPNIDAANGGYWSIDSHTGLTSITSNSLTSDYDWTGAEIVIRAAHWMLDKATVQAHSGNTVTFNDNNVTNIRDKYGFFFQNTPSALDVDGEWCYINASKKIQLYSTTDPSALDIAVANINYSFNLENKSNIIIEGIKFIGSKLASVRMYNSENFIIRNCTFEKTGAYACIMGKRWNNTFTKNITFENNTFSKTQSSCIEGGGENITVTGNSFTDIAMVPGMGVSGNKYLGLHIYVDNLLLEKNRFVRIGYMPMHLASSSNAHINKNYIDSFLMILDDGGGVYFYTGTTGNTNVNRKITDNIILNGIGALDGTDRKWTGLDGIYYDDNSSNIISEGNTIAYIDGPGINYHNSHNISSINNTVFACKYGVKFQTDKINDANVINNTVKNNIIVSTDIYDDELMFKYLNYRSPNGGQAGLQAIGVVDSNYYCKPFAGDQIFSAFNTKYNHEGWKNYSGFDKNSVLSPVQYESFDVDEHIRFEYNASDNIKTITADQNYITPRGIIYDKGTKIEIRPYGSVVLLMKDIETGISGKKNNSRSVSVYPNPVSTELYVKRIEPNTIYSIYNLNGKKVLEGEISDVETISLEKLKSGYYILSTMQGKTTNKIPFIKQ
jgi:hypothetical protein